MKTPLFLALATAAPIAADSTISPGDRHSYSGNGGWLDARWRSAPAEGVVVTESLLSGFIYAANYGWIDVGDGTPANGHSYAQSDGEFGVNHDARGGLSGYAYGANIGWIRFDWSATDHPVEPRLDLATGRFSGYVYGANVGWIRLDAAASAFLATDTLKLPDSDNDGIADWWELQNTGNLAKYTAVSDADDDDVSDLAEYQALTDPEDPASFLRATGSYIGDSTVFEITFPSNAGRRYRIQTGIALDDWADSGLGTFDPDPGETTTKLVTIPGTPTDDRRFFRVVTVIPLQ